MAETTFCVDNLLTDVSSLSFDNNGYLYAGNFGSGGSPNVIQITPDGQTATIFASFSFAFNENVLALYYLNNYLYVTTNNNNFDKIEISSGNISTDTSIDSSQTLYSRGFTYYNNNFYVVSSLYDFTDPNQGTNIYMFAPGTPSVNSPFITLSGISAVGIAIDTNGNIYITDITNSYVAMYDSSGTLVQNNFIDGTVYSETFSTIVFYNNLFYLTGVNDIVYTFDINGALVNNNYAIGGTVTGQQFGGGIAFDSTNNFYVSNGNGNSNQISTIQSPSPPPPTVPCFKHDSKILTSKGYIPIQDLRKGDLVKTINHEYLPIDMIGKRKLTHLGSNDRNKNQLYKCIPKNYQGLFEDLVITGGHSILVDGFKDDYQRRKTREVNGDLYVTDNKYRLPICADLKASVYEKPGDYMIYHLALENNNYYGNYGIYANGLLVESCSKRYLKEFSNMTMF